MLCSNCHQHISDTAKFCEFCGAKVVKKCPNCGYTLTGAPKFCPECGSTVASEEIASKMSETVKLQHNVSLLAADVEGSTRLISDKDVEQAREWLEAATRIMVDAVKAFHGTVLNVAGDGVVTYFTGEQHGLLACFAAAEIQAQAIRSNLPLSIRVGLHTMQMNLDQLSQEEGSAEIKLAQQIEAHAPAQKIQISEPLQKDYKDYIITSDPMNIVAPEEVIPITTYTLIKLLPEAKQLIEERLESFRQAEEAEQSDQEESLIGERKFVTSVFIQFQRHEHNGKTNTEVYSVIEKAIRRFEGTLIKKMSDTVFAIFGAPVTFEDHPLRACLAAYIIQQELADVEKNGDLRIGIHTGEAVTDNIGSKTQRQYDALGASVSLAARMMQTATSNQIQLSADTYHLVEKAIQTLPLGKKQVKGFAKGINTYLLTGLQREAIRKQMDAQFYGDTPFVGRHEALQLFNECYAEVEKKHGKLLAIKAEAGVGKTRLLFECVQQAMQKNALLYSVSALAYEKNESFALLRGLLRNIFGVNPGGITHIQENHIITRLKGITFTETLSQSAILSMLRSKHVDVEWIGLAFIVQQRILFKAIGEFLIHENQASPLIVAFEDMHWCDSDSLALILALNKVLEKHSILILLDYRPEFHLPEELLQYGQEHELMPLSKQDSQQLIHDLLPGDETLDSLRNDINQITEGNPFFIEQYVKHLVKRDYLVLQDDKYHLDKEIDLKQLPQTIQSVVTSQIDQLNVEEKRCLQQASVLGRVFPFSLLRYISELDDTSLSQTIRALEEYGFIGQTALLPEPEYTFHHAYICDAAYHNMLSKIKEGYHRRLVEQIEQYNDKNLESFYALLANHAYKAKVWDKALYYFNKMTPSEHNIEFPLSQYLIICSQAEQCFFALEKSKQEEAFYDYGRLMLLYEHALFVMQDYQKLQQLRKKIAEQSELFHNQFLKLFYQAMMLTDGLAGHATELYPSIHPLLTEMNQLIPKLEKRDALELKLTVNMRVLHTLGPLGYYDELDKILDGISQKDLNVRYIGYYSGVGFVSVILGLYAGFCFHRARFDLIKSKFDLIEPDLVKLSSKSEPYLMLFLVKLAYLYGIGNLTDANQLMTRIYNLALEIENFISVSVILPICSAITYYCGNPEQALAYARQSHQILIQTNYYFAPFMSFLTAETLVNCKAYQEADELVNVLQVFAESDHLKPMMAQCYCIRAQLLNRTAVDNSHDQKIEELLEKSKQLTEEVKCNLENPKIHLAYAEYYSRLSNKQKSEEHFAKAMAYFKEYGMHGWVEYYTNSFH